MLKAQQDLEQGVVLAELGGSGNGPYCAMHGANAALVMLGTYIVDPGDAVPYPGDFVFKPDRSVYRPYLREHIAAGRAGGGIQTSADARRVLAAGANAAAIVTAAMRDPGLCGSIQKALRSGK